MNNSLKVRFNTISQKVIAVDELEKKIPQVKNKLNFVEKSLVVLNDGMKMVTVGLGEIAKDIVGLPTNTGTYEDPQGKFYITGKQFKRMFISFAFNDELSEKFLSVAEQCQDHNAAIQSGQLKKFTL